MTGFISDKDRTVIPRWRTLEQTAGLGELDPSHAPVHRSLPKPNYRNTLTKLRSDWEKNQSVGHALDFATTAIFANKSHEAQSAIDFLTHNKSSIPQWTMALLEELMPRNYTSPSPPPPTSSSIREEAKKRIRNLRPLIHVEPKDPITQVDLAHAYATLGLNDKAAQCITVAQQLAPNNRFVLRSASRFWVHVNDNDKAHHTLTDSDRTPHDPWLMSAEIAVGNQIGITPVFAQKAHTDITEQTFLESHVSELASAAATIDWHYGAIQKAKRLFDKSLKIPTENSLAQAVWFSSKENLIHLNENLLSLPNTYEAKARNYCLNGKWQEATHQCQLWQLDQPFSIEPGIEGSFISIVALENFHLAKQFALTGLEANPNEPILLNNLAVALINLDNLKEARQRLSQINPSEYPDSAQTTAALITKTATTGLLHYRKGEIARARQLYFDAISLAETLSTYGPHLISLATAFQAIEENRLQTPLQHQLLEKAIQLLNKHNNPTRDILRKKLLNLLRTPPTHNRAAEMQ